MTGEEISVPEEIFEVAAEFEISVAFHLDVLELIETVFERFLFFRIGVGLISDLGEPGVLRTGLVSFFLELIFEDAFF